MNCPKCSGMMSKEFWETIEIEVCNICAGIWLDAGEVTKIRESGLAKVIDDAYISADEGKHNREIKCPHCNIELSVIKYKDHPSLVYDGCELCFGVFLDDGELEKLETIDDDRKKAKIDNLLKILSSF